MSTVHCHIICETKSGTESLGLRLSMIGVALFLYLVWGGMYSLELETTV